MPCNAARAIPEKKQEGCGGGGVVEDMELSKKAISRGQLITSGISKGLRLFMVVFWWFVVICQ